jgi:ABC-type proline/glycine betaine transport system permease subunit
MRFLLLLFSLALTCGIRAGTIVPDNATTTLWPDGAPFSFFDFASTGGGTDFNATTADFIRSFGAPDVGTEGTRVTIRGLAWATSGTLADVPATSATVTITYLGGDGVPGGGDDVLAGSVTNAFSYSGTPSEMVWIFDEPLVLDNDGLNSMYRIRVAANGNIRYKTYSGTSGADNVKLSVAGSSEALGEVQERLFPHKSMFVAGGLFNEQVAALRNSGFDTAILWSVHVNTSGVLSLNNDTLIDASGNYVYGQWARTNCALLKQPPTTISRIEFSVGSYGATDFEAIEFLVNKSPSTGGGTGAGSILRRNFQALRDNFPQVDAINFDDESNYDVASTTAFAIMLADLGYKITFCPYTRRTTFWGPLYGAIEAARPGAVDHIYLQCYDGGVFNNPATWNASFGSLKVEPGLWAGIGTTPAVLTSAIIVIFPIAVIVSGAVAAMDTDLRDVLRSLGASRLDVLRKVAIPQAMPQFFGSLKIAITLAFVGTILSESIAGNRGLGYMMNRAASDFEVELVFSGLLSLSVAGIMLYCVAVAFEKYFVSWAYRRE